MPQRDECVKTRRGVSRTRILKMKGFRSPSAKEDICDMVSLFKRASSLDL